MSDLEAVPDPIDAAWRRVLERWEDPEAHAAFLALCVQLERMPEAGRRYREVREHDPDRREEAARRIDELLTLATRNLQLHRTPPPGPSGRRRLFWVALGLSVTLVFVALWTMLGPR